MEEEKKQEAPQESVKKREAGMMCCTGVQGVGKTYQNMHVIANYVKDKPESRVKGRKCLIFDTNGEYTRDQFEKNGIPNFNIKTIGMKDVEAWSRSPLVECRRIDAKHLGIKEKQRAMQYILKVYLNGMVVIEDINTYIISVTFMEEIVGGIVNLRHRAVDVLISYQSLRPVEPRIFQNSRWIRLHYQSDSIMDIKGKVPNLTLFRIAQLLVNARYFAGDERFFVYIYSFQNKIQGAFKKEEFLDACKKYLNSNKKYIKEYQDMNECSKEQALIGQSNLYYNQYYGNADKTSSDTGKTSSGKQQPDKTKNK